MLLRPETPLLDVLSPKMNFGLGKVVHLLGVCGNPHSPPRWLGCAPNQRGGRGRAPAAPWALPLSSLPFSPLSSGWLSRELGAWVPRRPGFESQFCYSSALRSCTPVSVSAILRCSSLKWALRLGGDPGGLKGELNPRARQERQKRQPPLACEPLTQGLWPRGGDTPATPSLGYLSARTLSRQP